MFPWSQTHRRVLATLALVAVSIVPAIVTVLLIWTQTRPGHVRDVEVELSRWLGAEVSIERVRHPRPNEDLLEGISLRPDSRGPRKGLGTLIQAASVRVVHDSKQVTLQFQGLRFEPGQAAAFVEQVDEWASRMRSRWERVSLIAPHATIVGPDGHDALTLADLACVSEQTGKSTRFVSSFRLPSKTGAGRHELAIVSQLVGSKPSLHVSFQTREGRLPATALSSLINASAWFGDDAEFEGEFAFRKSEATHQWEVSFQGSIQNVNFVRLVADHFPSASFGGTGELVVTRALWGPLPGEQGCGWVDVEGQIQVKQGHVGVPLLRSLAKSMRFRLEETVLARSAEAFEFDAFGLGFHLTTDGQLQLFGRVANLPQSDVVLTHRADGTPIMKAPVGVANVRGLWNALYPVEGDILVPATLDTHVMRYLPLPETARAASRGVQAN